MADDIIEVTKLCRKCGETKNITDFRLRPDRPCGVYSHCKLCGSKANKAFRIKNPEWRSDKYTAETARQFWFKWKSQHPDADPSKQCVGCLIVRTAEYFGKKTDSPDGLRSKCRECRSDEKREYYLGNKEACLKQHKEYRDSHPEGEYLRHKKWQEANRDKCAESSVRWRVNNPDKYVASRKRNNIKQAANMLAWQRANPEKCRAAVARWNRENPEHGIAYRRANRAAIDVYVKAWRRENPECATAYAQKRRSRLVRSIQHHNGKQLKALLIKQNYECASPFCFADLREVKKEVDHKHPLARGGSNGIENIQYLCAPCNGRKSWLIEEDWLRKEAILASKKVPLNARRRA